MGGRKSPARTQSVKSQQLLTQRKIFEDEISAGAKSSHQPAENVSKQRNQGKRSYLITLARRFVKRLILWVYEVLMRNKGRQASAGPDQGSAAQLPQLAGPPSGL